MCPIMGNKAYQWWDSWLKEKYSWVFIEYTVKYAFQIDNKKLIIFVGPLYCHYQDRRPYWKKKSDGSFCLLPETGTD